jgi:hypothetical protein
VARFCRRKPFHCRLDPSFPRHILGKLDLNFCIALKLTRDARHRGDSLRANWRSHTIVQASDGKTGSFQLVGGAPNATRFQRLG